MASFEKAKEKLLKTQGMHPYFDEKNKYKGSALLCSNCFNDEGLRIDASKIGIDNNDKCPKCSSEKGYKLTKELVRELCYRFFVRGTIKKFEYGGCPLIQMNEQHFNESNIHISPWLKNDVNLIEQAGEIGLFYYGPRFWMMGEVMPLQSIIHGEEVGQVISKILNLYPKHILNKDHPFYRIRVNPTNANEYSQYDSPPIEYCGTNRFDDKDFPILYGSPDLELCLHECRIKSEDEIYVAKLVPKSELKMLNLAALVTEEGETEFTSIDLAIHFLFLAENHSYHLCRLIAKEIQKAGFDGIIYPSYFSYLRTGHIPFDTVLGMSIRKIPQLKDFSQSQSIPNVALFGSPIKDEKLIVHSINKVIINSIKYDVTFGPSYYESKVASMPKDQYLEMRVKEYEDAFKNATKSAQNEKE
ncbi:MAG: RES family NAD+ phosphorylase [Flavipsychrobacter sp.]